VQGENRAHGLVYGEQRINLLGLLAGRVVHMTYTERETICTSFLFARPPDMKRATTSRKLNPERIKALIANAPEKVNDPDCPYDPNDAAAVAAFWKNGVVVKSGGVAAVRAALAERRNPGQRGPGKRPPKVAINIRLSPEVLEAFKATGSGWQTKVDGALKEWLKDHTPA
jgi:uncharacterized protein (DUF4415 family)